MRHDLPRIFQTIRASTLGRVILLVASLGLAGHAHSGETTPTAPPAVLTVEPRTAPPMLLGSLRLAVVNQATAADESSDSSAKENLEKEQSADDTSESPKHEIDQKEADPDLNQAEDEPRPDIVMPDLNTRRLIARVIRETQKGTRLFDGLVQSVAGLSDADLRRCGQMIYDAYDQEGSLIKEGPYVERARRLAGPVLAKANRDFEYEVHVVESDALNAFATAGGFLYLHTEIMDQLTDEQLQFVIGHEVAHVELAHTDSLWTYAERVGLLVGENVSVMVMVILSQHVGVGYSEDQELESDAWGFEKTRALGVTADDAISTFEILAAAANEPLEPAPESQTVLEELEVQRANHYRTHPPAHERIDQMRRLDRIKS